MLRLRDITVYATPSDAFNSSTPAVLRGIDLDLPAGSSLAVVGANGSGKSTLARIMAGLQAPDAGTVELHGATIRLGDVGLVLQDPAAVLVGGTVAEELAFARACAQRPREELQAVVHELGRRLDLESLLHRNSSDISGGEAQRVAIGAMLATGASVLVLDEPTSHLDGARARDVIELVRTLPASGISVVWITQVLADAAWCDRTLVLQRGEQAALAPSQRVLADAHLLSSAGLELPAGARLASRLRARGAPVDAGVLDVHGVVEALLQRTGVRA